MICNKLIRYIVLISWLSVTGTLAQDVFAAIFTFSFVWKFVVNEYSKLHGALVSTSLCHWKYVGCDLKIDSEIATIFALAFWKIQTALSNNVSWLHRSACIRQYFFKHNLNKMHVWLLHELLLNLAYWEDF